MNFAEHNILSPTRVDLSGGTLDCWPIYSLVDNDCLTINFSIGVYSQVKISKNNKIHIHLVDFNYKAEFSELIDVLSSQDEELNLLKCVLSYYKPNFGFKLEVKTQSPVGAGLGGSSSLMISLLKAFDKINHITRSLNELVHLAHNLEAFVIQAPTGTQDYYPAALTGLHGIHYQPQGISLESLPIPQNIINEHCTLVYTGCPHHSGINNWQVIKSVVEKNKEVLDALKGINQISHQMFSAIKSSNWTEVPILMEKEMKFRLQLTPYFTNSVINDLVKEAKDAGALSVKICGAGGGGCVFIWSDINNKVKVDQLCEKLGFTILPLQLSNQ